MSTGNQSGEIVQSGTTGHQWFLTLNGGNSHSNNIHAFCNLLF